MELLVEKLGLFPVKFPSKLGDYHYHTKNLTPLHDFRSKISSFITQIPLNPGNHEGLSKSLSLESLQNCFELINISNRAFAKLVVETNHPTSQWSGELTESHLSYTLNSLDLANSVTASLSHLNQAKMSVSLAVRLMKNTSRVSAAKYLKKIPTGNFQAKILIFGFEEETSRVSSKRERVILHALTIMKKIGLLAMGFVASRLCSDAKIYLEIRKLIPGGFDDSLIKVLDSRFCKEVMEIQGEMEEVREVNSVVEELSRIEISDGKIDEAVGELSGRLMALENSIQGIEKQADNLFSEVLGTRNRLIDNIRFK